MFEGVHVLRPNDAIAVLLGSLCPILTTKGPVIVFRLDERDDFIEELEALGFCEVRHGS